jgi:hypothetical protein
LLIYFDVIGHDFYSRPIFYSLFKGIAYNLITNNSNVIAGGLSGLEVVIARVLSGLEGNRKDCNIMKE